MENYKVIIDETFFNDLEEIRIFYNNSNNIDYYESLKEKIYDKIYSISQNPYLFNYDKEYDEEIRKAILINDKYNIFYYLYEEKKEVYILSITHFRKKRKKINVS